MYSDVHDILENLGKNVRPFFVSQHLDSPLIADRLEEDALVVSKRIKSKRFLDILSNKLSLFLEKTCNINQYKNLPLPVSAYTPERMILTVNNITADPVDCTFETQLTTKVAAGLNKAFNLPESNSTKGIEPNYLARQWYSISRKLDRVLDVLSDSRASGKHDWCHIERVDQRFTDHWISESHWIYYDQSEVQFFMSTYEMFLCTLDMVKMRYRAQLAAGIFYPLTNLHHRLRKQYEWQERCILMFGNKGFEIAKQVEALAKTYLTEKHDPIFSGDSTYEKTWTKIGDKLKKITPDPLICEQQLVELRYTYEEIMVGASLNEIVELFGMQKQIGHPWIYTESSGKSAAREALEPHTVSEQHANELRATWCSMFIETYVTRKGVWPGLLFPENSDHRRLKRLYLARSSSFTRSSIPHSDWDGVRFKKLCDFDYHPNYFELIDDKAISNYRSEVRAYWDKDLTSRSSRRLILEMLNRSEINLKEIVDMVSRRQVPRDFKIVTLYPKEKELKTAARMFAMMVFEMRLFFTSLEANTAAEIFPYLEAQTMIDDKVKISHRFYSMTKLSSDPSKVKFFIECDLSRWNLRWRGHTIAGIMNDLDDLFGLSDCYNYVHEFFAESLIVVRTPAIRPQGIEQYDPPESDLVWYHHQGGFEGIQQKTWTIATYAMIDRVLRDSNFSYRLTGQGDNQVLSIETDLPLGLNKRDYIRDLADSILEKLEVGCREVNQELKPEECLASSTVITYSKVVYISGCCYGLSIKLHARAWMVSNNEIPSIVSELGGLSSSCAAAADSSPHVLKTYLYFLYLATQGLRNRLRRDHVEMRSLGRRVHNQLKDLSIINYITILLYPSEFGGLPIVGLADYLYRGSADKTIKSLSLINKLAPFLDEAASILNDIQSYRMYSGLSDIRTLLTDPYCLPVKRPINVRSRANQMIREYIKGCARNKDVSTLISLDLDDHREKIISTLLSVHPFNPVFSASIYNESIAGETDRVLEMFNSVRTIQVMARSSGYNTSEILLRSSSTEFKDCIQSLLIPHHKRLSHPLTPARLLAITNDWRTRWKSIAGNFGLQNWEIVGVTSTTPLLFPLITSREVITESGVKLCMDLPHNALYTRGEIQPYLGAATSMQRSDYGYKIIERSRPAKSSEKLALLRSHSSLSTKLKNVLRQIALTRSSVDPGTAQFLPEYIGGAIQHRLGSVLASTGCYVVSAGNITSHSFFVSDEIPGLSGTDRDYAIMFQEYYCYLISQASLLYSVTDSAPGYRELCIPFSIDDIPILDERHMDITDLPDLLSNTQCLMTPVLYESVQWYTSLKGPLAVKKITEEVLISTLDDQTIREQALRAVIFETLSYSNLANYTVSGGKIITPQIKLDLFEMKRIGIRRIFDYVVCSCVITALYKFLTDILHGQYRNLVGLSLIRLTRAWSKVLLSLFSYKELLNDPFAETLEIGCSFKTTAELDNSARLIAGKMMESCNRLLNKKYIFNKTLVLFKSESTGLTSVLFGAVFIHSLWRSIKGRHAFSTLVLILQGMRNLYHRAADHEAERIRVIHKMVKLVLTSPHMTQEFKDLFSQSWSRLTILIVNEDHRRQIRLWRTCPALLASPDPPRLMVSHSVVQLSDRHKSLVYNFRQGIRVESRFERRLLTSISHVTSGHGLFYTCHYTVLQAIKPTRLILVGVGRGVAVEACIDSIGAPVIGIDKRSAYNLVEMRQGRKPAAIAGNKFRHLFTWGPESLLNGLYTADDWSSLFLTYSTVPGSLFFVDIQPPLPMEQLIRYIENVNTDPLVLFRTRMELSQSVLHKYLLALPTTVKVLAVYSDQAYLWVYNLYSKKHETSSYAIWKRLQPLTSLRSDNSFPSLLPSNRGVFLAIVQRELARAIGVIESFDNINDSLSSLRDLIGKTIISEDYHSWTETLSSLILLEWIERFKADPMHLVALYNSHQTEVLRKDGSALIVSVSPHCKRLIQSSCILLSSYLLAIKEGY